MYTKISWGHDQREPDRVKSAWAIVGCPAIRCVQEIEGQEDVFLSWVTMPPSLSSTIPISLGTENGREKFEESLCLASDPVPQNHEETVLDSCNEGVGKKAESFERGFKSECQCSWKLKKARITH